MKGLTAEVNQINKKVEKKNLFFFSLIKHPNY